MPEEAAAAVTPASLFSPDVAEEIQRYVDILRDRGIEWGLIGPREGDRIFSRHVLNSVALESLVPQGVDVVDVGSGAGLPGIPLALVRSDLHVTLLEPLLRRVNFLSLAVDELGLGERVRVVRGRAEQTRETFDVVTARAVAPLDRLVMWTAPLLAPHGEILALKGASAAEEISTARKRLHRLGLKADLLHVRAHPDAEATSVVRVRRAGAA